ncbi:MAG TPA: molybdenum ABC transporter ATP-binding protein [Terriglobales bacterium]|nr:molybdenum ABC transporter ATP-binding protein [Terriglobales bacterium]
MAVEIKTMATETQDARQMVPPDHAVSIRVRKALGTDFHLDVDFAARSGITILFGASGAGKTTLLNCIAAVTTPDRGRIGFDRALLFDSETGVDVPISKRRAGYVFQTLALFPHLTVEENVQYGLASVPVKERKNQVREILESFRIGHIGKRKPSEISGGERQRVALARSLVTHPRILLLDEPLAALDASTKAKIMDDLRTWNAEHRIPILYVTHSREEVFALGERVIVLDRGKIVADGTPHEVIRAPRQETIAQLAGFENVFTARVTAVHEDRGTLTCRLDNSIVELETPLVSAEVGTLLRVAISAGDILLAAAQPAGLSARNIIPGKLISLEQRDVIVMAAVNCGVEMQVQLTLVARDALHLRPGNEVWLIVKTHSCHLLAG